MHRALWVLALLAACRPDPLPGLSPEAADRYLRRLEKLGFGGAVLIADRDKVLLTDAYGLADLEQGRPNTVNTLFPIGFLSGKLTNARIQGPMARGYAQGKLWGGDGPYADTGLHATVADLFKGYAGDSVGSDNTLYPFGFAIRKSGRRTVIVVSNVAEFPAAVIAPHLERLILGESVPLPPDVVDVDTSSVRPGRFEGGLELRREGPRLVLSGDILYPTSPSEFATYDIRTGESLRVTLSADFLTVGHVKARRID